VIAENAALSRLRPIPDGPDQWEIHRSSEDSGLGGAAPEGDRDNVLTHPEALYTKIFYWPDNDYVKGRVSTGLQGAPSRDSPTRGYETWLKEPHGALPRKYYLFVHLFIQSVDMGFDRFLRKLSDGDRAVVIAAQVGDHGEQAWGCS
jgi:hypothetical protein